MSTFHRPVKRPGDIIEMLSGSGDPAEISELARETASALLHGVRVAKDPGLVDAVIAYADTHGIDDVADLWADSPADTLPGALWRLYWLRFTVANHPEQSQLLVNIANSSADEVVTTITEILRGAFTGDFAAALEAASSFSADLAAGATAQSRDPHPSVLWARSAAQFNSLGLDLSRAASLWRRGYLS